MKLSRRRFLVLGGQMAALGLSGLWAKPARAEATLDFKIGQMLLMGFSGAALSNGNAVVTDVRDRHIGGVLLFDANIQSSGQLKKLTADLQALSAPTPL